MSDEKNLLSAGLHIVNRHKRYVLWFWILNLAIAWFGAIAFRQAIASTLDHSLLADRLLHGFDVPVFIEIMMRPETGSTEVPAKAATHFAFVFLFATLIFLPGVFEGYINEGRLSRENFFRACGRNLWRFIRVFLTFAIVAGTIAQLLFLGEEKLVKLAGDSTNELLPFITEVSALALIFLIVTALRIWFDLAQVDIVARDQRAIRKSLAAGFRYTRRYLLSLLGSYVLIALVAAAVLIAGVWVWHVAVPPASVGGAFVVSQIVLILWLWARFWQRGTAAAFYLREMAVPPPAFVPVQPVASAVPLPPPLGPEGIAPS
jgi:hypothetical protein